MVWNFLSFIRDFNFGKKSEIMESLVWTAVKPIDLADAKKCFMKKGLEHCEFNDYKHEADYSYMCYKVFTDWQQNYIKTTHPVLEIFKMTGHFLDKVYM